ncbi:FAD-binding protein [Kibdelosporangium philippinense]|uniref:FAD-binding protein n=1 Tax=Kibdelosporangium philippinense TaxID=211113 RepID=A0ABS8ZGU8_9PSEU|nr:FAD-binding protein [Kibdelosporangium philippinense]MCE7006782.1 FAD-binding protein [Kibdelosporangium philippinense]
MINTDDAVLSWAADDFGHIVHTRPRGVLRPRTVGEIKDALATGVRLRPRGEGHSTAGQAQISDGVVVDMRGLDTVNVTGTQVTAGAGARWSSVLAAALQAGLTPPVLTDYLELSVGGTLSVGGIGGMTHRHGMQVDNVVSLDVLTPDGVLETCDSGAPLFDLVRGGYGGHGIIVSATLRLVPAPSRVYRYKLPFSSLAPFMTAQRELMESRRFDYLEGMALPDGTFEISLATYSTPALDLPLDEEVSYTEFANRLVLEDMDKPHPWLNVFLPEAAVPGFVASIGDVGPTGTILIYPFDTRLITAPAVALPSGEVAYLVAVLRTAQSPTSLTQMLAGNANLRQRTLDAGGCVYLDGSGTP